MRCLMLTALFLWPALTPLAAETEGGGGPTIAAMLKDAEAMAAQEAAPLDGKADPNALVEDSKYVKAMKNSLNQAVGRRAGEYKKNNDYRRVGDVYFNVQWFEEAIKSYHEQIERNRGDHWVRLGLVHLALSRAYEMYGQPERAAEALAAAAERSAGEQWAADRVRRYKDWLKALPGRKKEVAALRAKAAANLEDSASRWRLIELYYRDCPRHLDEFVGLMQFRELYADNEAVTGGECDWRLMRSLWGFGIREEAFGMAVAFREKYPGHWATKNGEATWRLGNYYESKDKDAEARACYVEVSDKFPKHWTCTREHDGRPYIQYRIGRVSSEKDG